MLLSYILRHLLQFLLYTRSKMIKHPTKTLLIWFNNFVYNAFLFYLPLFHQVYPLSSYSSLAFHIQPYLYTLFLPFPSNALWMVTFHIHGITFFFFLPILIHRSITYNTFFFSSKPSWNFKHGIEGIRIERINYDHVTSNRKCRPWTSGLACARCLEKVTETSSVRGVN